VRLKHELRFPAGHCLHGSYGVGSSARRVDDSRSYEIYKVLDHAIWLLSRDAHDKNSGRCVSSDDPYLLNFSGDAPIPVTLKHNGKTVALLKRYTRGCRGA
jgi:hypothetical protein